MSFGTSHLRKAGGAEQLVAHNIRVSSLRNSAAFHAFHFRPNNRRVSGNWNSALPDYPTGRPSGLRPRLAPV